MLDLSEIDKLKMEKENTEKQIREIKKNAIKTLEEIKIILSSDESIKEYTKKMEKASNSEKIEQENTSVFVTFEDKLESITELENRV